MLMVWLAAADHPPKPPTSVQKEMRKYLDKQSSFQDFLLTCRLLLKNKSFLIVLIAGSIIYLINSGEYTMTTQLMTKVLRGSNYNVDIMSITQQSCCRLAVLLVHWWEERLLICQSVIRFKL